MCGRMSMTCRAELVAEVFDVRDVPLLPPRINVAPTQPVLAVMMQVGESRRVARYLRWGLIPSWAKDKKIGATMINARSETAAAKPAFRSAMRDRRCLIVADGFYEWAKIGPKKKPYHIRLADGQLLGFAGIWERWSDPDNGVLDTCSILTTQANAMLASLHDRMPVIVPPQRYGSWLAGPLAECESLWTSPVDWPLVCEPWEQQLPVESDVVARLRTSGASS